ncbi:hypothetical protein ACIBVL_34695 [Streptomyces sp. NPDC049687]|uniref:hypothetical protein n=1 Tax=Streptomyces sp. NPDC049687 TaxID=3365596 RepID=UPI0037B8C62D
MSPTDTAALPEGRRGAVVGTVHWSSGDVMVPVARSEPAAKEKEQQAQVPLLPASSPLPRRQAAGPRHAAPPQSADLHLTPLYAALASEWEARGAVLPGAPDPDWRFASWPVMDAEVCRTLRNLRLQRAVPE